MTHTLGLGVSARSTPGRAGRPRRFVFGKGEAKKERMKLERSDEIRRLKEAIGDSIAEGARLRAETRRALAALEDARVELELSAARASSRGAPDDNCAEGLEFDIGECVAGQFSSCDARQIAQQTSMTFLAVVALLLEQDLSNTAVEDIRSLTMGGDVGDPFSIFLRFGIPMSFGFLAYFFKALSDMGHVKIKL